MNSGPATRPQASRLRFMINILPTGAPSAPLIKTSWLRAGIGHDQEQLASSSRAARRLRWLKRRTPHLAPELPDNDCSSCGRSAAERTRGIRPRPGTAPTRGPANSATKSCLRSTSEWPASAGGIRTQKQQTSTGRPSPAPAARYSPTPRSHDAYQAASSVGRSPARPVTSH